MIKSDNNLEIEKYITVVKNNCHGIALTRIRCSAHTLMIEEGRYRNIDRNQRLCTKCNMNVIENEFHFVLVCLFYRQLRKECLPRYYCHWQSLFIFKRLMKSTNNKLITKVAKRAQRHNTCIIPAFSFVTCNCLESCRVGLVVSVSASRTVGRGFASRLVIPKTIIKVVQTACVRVVV